MLTALLPGLRDLRAPLASGGTWLVVIWLLWGRNLPAHDEATGLLKDIYTLAEHLGTAATLGAIAFISYLIGELWAIINISALSRWFRFKINKLVTFRGFTFSPYGIGHAESSLLRFFTTSDAIFADLLPKLGVNRPDYNSLTSEGKEELYDALYHDLNRVPTLLLDNNPDLRAEHDRYWSEYLFRQYLAIPLGICIFALIWAASPTWWGIVTGAVIGFVAWFGISHSAARKNSASWLVLLEAVYLGKLQAPTLVKYGLKTYGPCPPNNSEETLSPNDELHR